MNLRLPLSRPTLEILESRIAPATVLALTSDNALLRFDSSNPTGIVATTAIQGLGAGETLVDIDFRPYDGFLYGLTVDAFYSGRVYRIDPSNGDSILVAALSADPTDLSSPFTTLNG